MISLLQCSLINLQKRKLVPKNYTPKIGDILTFHTPNGTEWILTEKLSDSEQHFSCACRETGYKSTVNFKQDNLKFTYWAGRID